MADRALRIAIDGRELLGQPTGVGRYLLSVLRRWTALDGPSTTPHHYNVVVPAEPGAELRAIGGRLAWHIAPARSTGTRWEQMTLPRALRRLGPDVLFAPAYTAPLRSPCPFVVLIHDVSFHAHPEWFAFREGLRRRWLTRASARRAAGVVTVSEFSRSEVSRWLGLPATRLLVASPAADAGHRSLPDARPPVVLYAGSLLNRRHVPLMIDAFARAAAAVPDAQFILAGDNRTHPHVDPVALAREAGVGDRVEWRRYVPEAELIALYSSARVFVFLSDYEGFGIPPLEALAYGAAPVVLDTPISREVYGDAALRVPADASRTSDAIVHLLGDAGARAALVDAGRSRLGHYSWNRAAATITKALEDAAR